MIRRPPRSTLFPTRRSSDLLDRHALVDVVKDVAPMLVGGFVYPFHELSTPAAELVSKRLGYQKRSEEHTSELQSLAYLVCRLLLEKKNNASSTTSDIRAD